MALGHYDPESFWALTPREANARFKASGKRVTREYNERVTQAFQTALFSTAQKKIKLETYLISDEPKKARTQSWEEQLAVAMQWSAATR